ncbi:MAG TPA: hypothetical protein PLQ69_03860 [Paludibacter sp.]|jgi:hypothetical protein|nr:hypothetical protein [Paludibacter sp.]
MQKKHQITITGEKFDDLCELKIEQFRIFHSTLLLIHFAIKEYFKGRKNKTIKVRSADDKRINKSSSNNTILVNHTKMVEIFDEIFDEFLPDSPVYLEGNLDDFIHLLYDMNIKQIDNIDSLYYYAQACLLMGQYYYSLKKRVPRAFDRLLSIEYLSYKIPRYAFDNAGYWRNRLLDDIKMLQERIDSGSGQKKAEKERQKKLADELRKLMNNEINEIAMDEGDFIKCLNTTFKGREDYPRHYTTRKKYKEAVEKILGKKIQFK